MKITSYGSVFFSMARVGLIRDLSVGASVPTYVSKDTVDCRVTIPGAFKALMGRGLDNTNIFYDKQKKLFTVRIVDSIVVGSDFNCTLDGQVTSCEFYWDDYCVRVKASSIKELSISKIVSLVKGFPHDVFSYIQDNCLSNLRIKQALETKLKSE